MKYYGNETDPAAHMSFNFGLITYLNDHSKATDFSDTINQWLNSMPKGKWSNWVVSVVSDVGYYCNLSEQVLFSINGSQNIFVKSLISKYFHYIFNKSNHKYHTML